MSPDLASWLAELVYQQHHRSPEITEEELKRSWDRFLDNLNAARTEEGSMTTDNVKPQGLELASGEIVTVTCTDDGSVLVALYAVPEAGKAGDDVAVPAPAMRLDPNEAEVLGSLMTSAAVAAYSKRRRPLRPVNGEDDE
jgi:hypothetical protein